MTKNKNSNNSQVVLILIVVFLVAAAVGGYFWYRSKENDSGKTIKLVLNPDGSVSEQSGKEYFLYDNQNTPTEPISYYYYTDKATRGPIWNGLISMNDRECTAPHCTHLHMSDKQGMQIMLNDVFGEIQKDIVDYRSYLIHAGIETSDKFNAKYKTYVPMGYTTYQAQSRKGIDYDITHKNDEFMFNIMIKGYAEYKGISIPSGFVQTNYQPTEDNDQRELYATLPILRQIEFISMIMSNMITLSTDGPKRHIVFNVPGGTRPVILKIGVNYPYVTGLLIIYIILILQEGKILDEIQYNPPSTNITFDEIKTAMHQAFRDAGVVN